MKLFSSRTMLDLIMDGRGIVSKERIANYIRNVVKAAELWATATGMEYTLECGHTVQMFGRKWDSPQMPCLECMEAAEASERAAKVEALQQPAAAV